MTGMVGAVRKWLGGGRAEPPAAQQEAAQWKTQGNAALAAGDLAAAAHCYRRMVDADPGSVDAHVNLGYALLELGQPQEAEGHLARAVSLAPASHDARYLLATARNALGRNDEARADLEAVLQLSPDFEFARRDLGQLLVASNRMEEALAVYDAWRERDPASTDAAMGRLLALLDLERWQEALEDAQALLAAGNGDRRAQSICRARALHGLGQHEQALPLLETLVADQPDDIHALHGQGNVLFALGRYAEALAVYQRVLAIDPQFAEALMNSGAACEWLSQWERALEFHQRALALDAGQRVAASALYNMGCTLLATLRCRETIEVSERGLRDHPDNANLQWNKAIGHLLLGEFEQGWPAYESRWRLDVHGPGIKMPQLGLPQWTGAQPLEGKRILVFAEQGFGDALQFVRYVPLLAARGAKVLLAAPPPLMPLMATIGHCEVVPYDQARPDADFMCPLLSLPLAFGTTLSTVPAAVPYLHSEPGLCAQWEERLGPKTRPRIGLVWSGNAAHRNDANRSLPLGDLLSLAAGVDCQWVSLQKEVRESDRAALEAGPILDVSPQLRSFADTAALVEVLDLVISVDTSVAHLAGALGKPLWVLLPYCPDWRWMVDREDSPWYPSARLFRQDEGRRWLPVIGRLAAALATGPASA